jgi:hypothetical protein
MFVFLCDIGRHNIVIELRRNSGSSWECAELENEEEGWKIEDLKVIGWIGISSELSDYILFGSHSASRFGSADSADQLILQIMQKT